MAGSELRHLVLIYAAAAAGCALAWLLPLV